MPIDSIDNSGMSFKPCRSMSQHRDNWSVVNWVSAWGPLTTPQSSRTAYSTEVFPHFFGVCVCPMLAFTGAYLSYLILQGRMNVEQQHEEEHTPTKQTDKTGPFSDSGI